MYIFASNIKKVCPSLLLQSAGKLIETGLNTLQKTLLLKREVEVENVTQELQTKRIQFQRRMEECEKKRVELQKKQQMVFMRLFTGALSVGGGGRGLTKCAPPPPATQDS